MWFCPLVRQRFEVEVGVTFFFYCPCFWCHIPEITVGPFAELYGFRSPFFFLIEPGVLAWLSPVKSLDFSLYLASQLSYNLAYLISWPFRVMRNLSGPRGSSRSFLQTGWCCWTSGSTLSH